MGGTGGGVSEIRTGTQEQEAKENKERNEKRVAESWGTRGPNNVLKSHRQRDTETDTDRQRDRDRE